LKADHRTVEKVFRDFERSSETAHKTRRKLVDEMIAELSVHAAVEEQFLYPAARRAAPQLESDVLEAVEADHGLRELGPVAAVLSRLAQVGFAVEVELPAGDRLGHRLHDELRVEVVLPGSLVERPVQGVRQGALEQVQVQASGVADVRVVGAAPERCHCPAVLSPPRGRHPRVRSPTKRRSLCGCRRCSSG